MIRTIVVHLDSGQRCAVRVAIAIGLARHHGSRLVGVAPTGLPDVVITMRTGVPDAIEIAARAPAVLREQAEVAAHEFELRCKAAGHSSFESHAEIGESGGVTAAWGRCSDLVIVGQTDVDKPVSGVAQDLPQQVLLKSGAPLLVVPYAGTFTTIGRKVLVGWKDTREAARAVRDALPLISNADDVHLLEAREPPATSQSQASIAGAAAWLTSHGLVVRTEHDAGLDHVGDRLLSRAADLGADLIVVGGYGHSRLREWVLGGVTHRLLRQMTVPTLLSH
jgi:nucleotide-binding universal stress UspA family protein